MTTWFFFEIGFTARRKLIIRRSKSEQMGNSKLEGHHMLLIMEIIMAQNVVYGLLFMASSLKNYKRLHTVKSQVVTQNRDS